MRGDGWFVRRARGSDQRSIVAGRLVACSLSARARRPDSEVAVPSRQAWLDLEFLTWHINGPYGRWEDRRVHLIGTAAPPFENEPGRMIVWELWGVRGEGDGVEPDEVAASLRRDLDELYVPHG